MQTEFITNKENLIKFLKWVKENIKDAVIIDSKLNGDDVIDLIEKDILTCCGVLVFDKDCEIFKADINDKDRRILDIAVSLAKHIIVIYNGKIDIKTDSDKNIEVTIELNLDKDIKNYKSRVRDDNDEFIYQKYLNMCNF